MNIQLTAAWLCSFCVHALVFSLLPQSHYEIGYAPKGGTSQAPLNVEILAAGDARQKLIYQEPVTHHTGTKRILPREKKLPEERSVEPEVHIIPTNILDAQNYFAPGQLTRRAFPIDEIDLDISELSELGFTGQIELILLVDNDGRISDVITLKQDEAHLVFAEHVSEIFKNSRFSPGEINGKAVKSQLRITVVSEPRLNPESLQ